MPVWIEQLRPRQWTKNLFLLSPLVFARQLLHPQMLLRALAAFALFCLLSSAVYVFNDLLDLESDRRHPLKKKRPLASGRLKPSGALAGGLALSALALTGAVVLEGKFFLAAVTYLALNLFYSRWLKKVAFLDAAAIAAGFVLRVVAGAEALPVPLSRWIIVCTFCLAFFLALGKRRHELGVGAETRASLSGYDFRSLARWQWIAAAATVVSYLAYTLDPLTASKFGTHWLAITALFPPLGLWRFMVLQRRSAEPPTDAVIGDAASWAIVAGWTVASLLVIYFR